MGFDEAKVNRNAPGSSEGGQFAAKDAGRDSAGQVSDAFGTDDGTDFELVERLATDELRELVAQRLDIEAMGPEMDFAIERALADGDLDALRTEWAELTAAERGLVAAEAAGLPGMSPATREHLIEQLDRQAPLGFQRALDASRGHFGFESQPLGTGDVHERLRLVAMEHGVDVGDPEMASRLHAVARQASGFDADTEVHVSFGASAGEVFHAMDHTGVMRVPLEVRVGYLRLPLTSSGLGVRPGDITFSQGSWTGARMGAPTGRRVADAHDFDRHLPHTRERSATGEVTYTQKAGSMTRTHVELPDGSQRWTMSYPGYERVEELDGNGNRTITSRDARGAVHRNEHRVDGSSQSHIETPNLVSHRSTTPEGVVTDETRELDTGAVTRATWSPTSFELVETDADGEDTTETMMATRPDGLIVGSHRSPQTGRPVEVQVRRLPNRRAEVRVEGRRLDIGAPDWFGDGELAHSATVSLDAALENDEED